MLVSSYRERKPQSVICVNVSACASSWKFATRPSLNQATQTKVETRESDMQYGPTPPQPIGEHFESSLGVGSFLTLCMDLNSRPFLMVKGVSVGGATTLPHFVWDRRGNFLSKNCHICELGTRVREINHKAGSWNSWEKRCNILAPYIAIFTASLTATCVNKCFISRDSVCKTFKI